MSALLFSFFKWLGATPLGLLIRDSKWGFAIAETVHLVALALFGGVILVLNLRLLGLGLKRQPVAVLARDLGPWFAGSLATLVTSGIVLTSGEAMKCFNNSAFRWKMLLLGLAVTLHYTLHRRAVESGFHSRAVGSLALLLWFGVVLAGRAIGLI